VPTAPNDPNEPSDPSDGPTTPGGPSGGRGERPSFWAPAVRDRAGAAMRVGLDQLVRRNLRGVWVRGALPSGPAVWISNHHSWWDYFVAAAALRSTGRTDVGVLMDAANIGRREVYRTGGVVGTDELRAAADMVNAGAVLVVFPEGRLLPAGPLGPTRPGGQWLADRTGAPVWAVATRVVLRAQQAPEAYLDVAPTRTPRPDGTVPPAEDSLRDQLARLDAELSRADPDEPLPGFRQVVPGVRSWHERIDKLVRR
jgi:1-acyl-sn-glycerol-3-phosphate acyltransferase